MAAARSHAAFVVRVSRDETGGVSGVVICAYTGERMTLRGVPDAGRVLMRAIAKEMPPSAGGDTPPAEQ